MEDVKKTIMSEVVFRVLVNNYDMQGMAIKTMQDLRVNSIEGAGITTQAFFHRRKKLGI